MSKPKVILLGKIEHAHNTWNSIESIADVVIPKSTDRAAFLAECDTGAFEGVSVAYRTFDSFSISGKVDAELLSHLPPSLKFICHNGAGYDQVDVLACAERGIRVSNTPSAVDDSTADIAMFLLLGALRNLNVPLLSMRKGEWRGKADLPSLGHDPQGKVLGILGMGGIGRNMAKKARAFGMKIRYHNRTRLSEHLERECEAEYRGFEDLLREIDVLSLNLPLNPATRHTISTEQFAMMKPGVVIVNTARGAVMDEAALVAALDSGHVASAGLDVYEDEPVVHPGLLANPRALLVPHMGTWTVETQTKMEEWTISNVKMAVQTGVLRSIVPEQKGMQD
ncbi:glyoxylate reductase [Pseudomassariella vexata]|uniref:Glyoxylate reductase n=1 Tax=Pseudomassariella vexata TaxID=1141098 RepID=A0A1Y2DSY6_9PEZI|nr:glyoxylate reductase [Pseudomassariella vexata]ORY62383.1 glyoxylate reductase [Pseudomassariella vexata]